MTIKSRTESAAIKITQIDAALGAVVECGDVRNLDQAARAALHQAWLDNIVLVIRGQSLDRKALLDLTSVFGQPTVAAVAPAQGIYQDVAIVSNIMQDGKPIGVLGSGEVVWHTDHSFQESPLAAALLYAVEIPPTGGDTYFSNMYLALDTLPQGLRRRIQGLTIKNDGTYNSAGERRTNDDISDVRVSPGVSHPIVRTHPETGQECLYLGRRPYAYVNGLSLEESEGLLNQLWAHATQDSLTWAHRWQVGDVLVWDNRCAMHRRGDFDPSTRRLMHRGQCVGERPIFDTVSASRGSHQRGHVRVSEALEGAR